MLLSCFLRQRENGSKDAKGFNDGLQHHLVPPPLYTLLRVLCGRSSSCLTATPCIYQHSCILSKKYYEYLSYLIKSKMQNFT